MLTPRQRVQIALRGGHGPTVPFTMYECMIPQCAAERAMRQRGLCIVQRGPEVYTAHHPNVRVTQQVRWEAGRKLVRTVYETPAGELSTLEEPAGFTVWRHEKMFKSPDDYPALLAFIRDERCEPNYAEFARARRWRGEDFIMRANLDLEPLQALISGAMMSMQDFCVEWMERRDEVLRLYEALVENRRRLYPLIADSPASHANYGGNVVPEVVGRENFERYFVPHYNEAAQALHARGKLIGCHLDANCRLLADAIGATDLDYIEAFTPAPDTDMALAEARAAWPEKVIWINFPSSVHVREDQEVERFTFEMLDELDTVDGLLVGITEDIPADRWQGSCRAIMDGLERHARERPRLYGRPQGLD